MSDSIELSKSLAKAAKKPKTQNIEISHYDLTQHAQGVITPTLEIVIKSLLTIAQTSTSS